MARRFEAAGLQVVGLHTPEFDPERDAASVRREAAALRVTWPVVLDNDYQMWDALGNHYWPTVYLIDRKGVVRHAHAGETHEGSPAALSVEQIVQVLLRESG